MFFVRTKRQRPFANDSRKYNPTYPNRVNTKMRRLIRKLADMVIDNRGSLEETQEQVKVLWGRIIKKGQVRGVPDLSLIKIRE